MKTIDTLVEDMYGLMGSGHEPSPEALDELGKAIAGHIKNALAKHEDKPTLRGSRIGETCDRRTWYDVNTPEDSEDFEGHTLFKFLSGHIFEEIVLFLAEQSGHKVTGKQLEVDVEGVKGHNDAIIDGVLVDVKTTTTRGIAKYFNNGLLTDDPFGYLDQIEFYKEGLQDNELLEDKQRYAFLGVSREQGRIALDIYEGTRRTGEEVRAEVIRKQSVVGSDNAPGRGVPPVPDGAGGNYKLDMKCVYCSFKDKCWPGMRKFKYSNGIRYLTTVAKEPLVEEILESKET